MIVLVCGGRNFKNKGLVFHALDNLPVNITKIVNGAASGADKLSTLWAKERNIKYQEYPANWKKWGRAAGIRRNAEMLALEKIDVVVAFPGGKGTADMVRRAKEAGVKVIKVRLGKPNKI